tara:strand:+ start:231 stop:839 length:609 start_codon:yes stop_codon:yes gene_type:complete
MKRGRAADVTAGLSAPPVVTERLPAKTLLYCALPKARVQEMAGEERDVTTEAAFTQEEQADSDCGACGLPASGAPLGLVAPRAPAPAGARWCEFALVRAASLARCVGAAPPADLHDCDGWRSADGHVVHLVDPEPLLRLIDDDKQCGVAQALLTDMFTRLQVKATPAQTSPRTAVCNRRRDRDSIAQADMVVEAAVEASLGA